MITMGDGYLARVFRSALNISPTTNPSSPHVPMLNSVSNSLSGMFASNSQIQKKKNLMSWYKLIPELSGLVNKVAKDSISMAFRTNQPQRNG